MYKDIINYELAEKITKDQLLQIAKKVVDSWMKHQPGFLNWEVHTNKEGSFTDIVYWQSEQDAKNAEKEMANMPNAGEWFACYKEGSINSKNLTLLTKF